MSILVKGMNMPTECEYCGFCRYYPENGNVWCNAKNRLLKTRWREPNWMHLDVKRPDWCPLVEIKTPHGRLIDEAYISRVEYWTENGQYNVVATEFETDAPTVIEAEED